MQKLSASTCKLLAEKDLVCPLLISRHAALLHQCTNVILHTDVVVVAGGSAFLLSAIKQLACKQTYVPNLATPVSSSLKTGI